MVSFAIWLHFHNYYALIMQLTPWPGDSSFIICMMWCETLTLNTGCSRKWDEKFKSQSILAWGTQLRFDSSATMRLVFERWKHLIWDWWMFNNKPSVCLHVCLCVSLCHRLLCWTWRKSIIVSSTREELTLMLTMRNSAKAPQSFM